MPQLGQHLGGRLIVANFDFDIVQDEEIEMNMEGRELSETRLREPCHKETSKTRHHVPSFDHYEALYSNNFIFLVKLFVCKFKRERDFII